MLIILRGNHQPNTVLSISMGFTQPNLTPNTPTYQGVFRDGFITRLFCAPMSSLLLNSQNRWRDHWNQLREETRNDHIWMNIPLQPKQSAIDDVKSMPELCKQVHTHLATTDDIANIRQVILASKFFFELNKVLAPDGYWYRCWGSILHKSPDSMALVDQVLNLFPEAWFNTSRDMLLGPIMREDICEWCGSYWKSVMFHVCDPSKDLTIFAVLNALHQQKISGFPYPMSWFQLQQGLNARFGHSDHQTGPEISGECSCVQEKSWANKEDRSKKRSCPSRRMRKVCKRRRLVV